MKKNKTIGRVAVLIPFYKLSLTKSEKFSLRNTLDVLGRHDIYIIGPDRLREYFFIFNEKKTRPLFRISLYPDKFFDSIDGYNKLLTSRFFYKSFSAYEYILIVQTDALVFSDQLITWCDKNYSYVGAPIFVGRARPEIPLSFLGVGNGGFSLRKVADFIRVLSIPRHFPNFLSRKDLQKSNFKMLVNTLIHNFICSYNFHPLLPRMNEDIFWGILVPVYCNFFKVPSAGVAVSFAFEVEPGYLYRLNHGQLPFGCHAWEKYDLFFWKQVTSERGIRLP